MFFTLRVETHVRRWGVFLTQSTRRPLPQPLPRREGRNMWGYPYWAANTVLGYFFSHRTHRFNRTFQPTFRTHRRPPAYRVHRALLLKMAVTFCEIGWLNVSVGLCVFCSSVFFCEKKNNCETRRGVLSLTERTEFTEVFGAHFELTERLRHTEVTERYC